MSFYAEVTLSEPEQGITQVCPCSPGSEADASPSVRLLGGTWEVNDDEISVDNGTDDAGVLITTSSGGSARGFRLGATPLTNDTISGCARVLVACRDRAGVNGGDTYYSYEDASLSFTFSGRPGTGDTEQTWSAVSSGGLCNEDPGPC